MFCILFTPIDSSYYFVHKSIKIQLPKKLIVYKDVLRFMSK